MTANRPVALITGASSGIGQATAELLAASGFTVFGTSRTPGGSQRSYTMLSLDVRSDALVQAAVRAILHQVGRIDVLVNNAGFAQAGAIEENSAATMYAQLDTNLFGVVRMTNAVLPAMRSQRRGRIINVSSVVGHVAPPYFGLYAASKFALEGLTEALRHEVGQFDIHVSMVEPGFVRTRIEAQPPSGAIREYDQGRAAAVQFIKTGVESGIEPRAVAQAILRIATTGRPRLRYRVGRQARVLIALKRLLPEPLFDVVPRRILSTPITDGASAPQDPKAA